MYLYRGRQPEETGSFNLDPDNLTIMHPKAHEASAQD